MKITSRAHYGVQVMADLAKFGGHAPLSLSEITRRERLPKKYLEQLMMALRAAKLVKSSRGVSGGYRLAKNPQKITFLEIIEALEGGLEPVACVSSAGKCKCPQEDNCLSQPIWVKLYKNLEKALESVTLGEIIHG